MSINNRKREEARISCKKTFARLYRLVYLYWAEQLDCHPVDEVEVVKESAKSFVVKSGFSNKDNPIEFRIPKDSLFKTYDDALNNLIRWLEREEQGLLYNLVETREKLDKYRLELERRTV